MDSWSDEGKEGEGGGKADAVGFFERDSQRGISFLAPTKPPTPRSTFFIPDHLVRSVVSAVSLYNSLFLSTSHMLSRRVKETESMSNDDSWLCVHVVDFRS